MYVSPICYIVQRFFKHYVTDDYVTDDDVRNALGFVFFLPCNSLKYVIYILSLNHN